MLISWTEIRKSPLRWAQSVSLKELVTVLKTCADAYTNGTKSKLSDVDYDQLKDVLEERKPDHSFLKAAGAPVQKGRTKVKLPIGMFSLNKIKAGTGSLEAFASNYPGPYVLSDKLDGLSLELDARQTPAKLYTRGNGTYGQDVSHLIGVIQGIPNELPKIVVRGEAVISRKAFASKFSKEAGGKYENPRNLASGAVNTLGIHAAASHLVFVAHGLMAPNMKPSAALASLKNAGFQLVPNTSVKSISPDSLSKILKNRLTKSVYDMDGLVVEQDVLTPLTLGNPEHKVAFKETGEDSIVETKVLEVVWEASKGGKLIPVVHIQPVRLAGATIKKASGTNAFFIEHGYRYGERDKGLPEMPIGPGAVVKATRSGDVIPYIISVVKKAKPQYPEGSWEYGKNKVDIYTTDKEDLARIKMLRLTSFFVNLGIDQVRSSVVSRMCESGYDTIAKILKMTPAQIAETGVGPNMSKKVYGLIHDKTSDVPAHILMNASQMFGNGLGQRRFEPIVAKFGPSLLLWPAEKSLDEMVDAVKELPGFSTTTASMFAKGLPSFVKWLKATGLEPSWPSKKKVAKGKFSGESVCFTGFRSKEMEDAIAAQGGSIASGVTSKTTMLVVNDLTKPTSKTAKAKSLGIKILDKDQLGRML